MQRAILDRGRLARIFAPVGTAIFMAAAAHFEPPGEQSGRGVGTLGPAVRRNRNPARVIFATDVPFAGARARTHHAGREYSEQKAILRSGLPASTTGNDRSTA